MRTRINRCSVAVLLLFCSNLLSAAKSVAPSIDTSNLPPRPNKAAVFFYRASEWIDNFVMKDLDTAYIGLPEHSWRLAFNTGMVGVNSNFVSPDVHFGTVSLGDVALLQRTTPSVNLGFYAGFRGFGFGYSWDAMNAYSQNMNLSLGGKAFGLEFRRQTSSNITGLMTIGPNVAIDFDEVRRFGYPLTNNITNTTLSAWYALNSAHYSHNAAIKQSYIQKKTAGSLLLQVHYASININLDTLLAAFTNKIIGIETQQVGVGIGYGINYTPNHGKVLLHASAMMQLICYSHNLVTHVDSFLTKTAQAQDTTVAVPALYRISSRVPVHITGTVRAAVSWEINKWVHLSAWAQGNNIRFMAHASDTKLDLSNWNWQVNLAVGVRLGAGYERRQKVLDAEEEYLIAEENEILKEAERLRSQRDKQDSILLAQAASIQEWNAIADSISQANMQEAQEDADQLKYQSSKTKRKRHRNPLPRWITDYFYSPMR